MATLRRYHLSSAAISAFETASWYLAMCVVALVLVSALRESAAPALADAEAAVLMRRSISGRRPCDEIYVVGEGETLHTISDKCGDPFIVEENPHIHDPDDVYPGLVLKITPFAGGRK